MSSSFFLPTSSSAPVSQSAIAPTLIIGRLIVGRQTPEYVGARQKRFAWIIGLTLSATMFVFLRSDECLLAVDGACLSDLSDLSLFLNRRLASAWGVSSIHSFLRIRCSIVRGKVSGSREQPIQKTSGWQHIGRVAVRGLCGWCWPYQIRDISGGRRIICSNPQLQKQNEQAT